MDDDYHNYMNAVSDEDRQEIQNKYSDKEMFDSMIDWHRINHRINAYPPIQEQLDMIYRCGLEHWKSEIEDIKSKYPDLTRGYTTRFHEMQKIETTQTQLKENLQTTQTQLGDLQTQLETTRTELEGELQTARTQLQNTRTELEITNLKLHNAEARIGTLEQTMTSILSKLNV